MREDFQIDKVREPKRFALFIDHMVPVATPKEEELHIQARNWGAEQGVEVHERKGIGHQVSAELGYGTPGAFAVHFDGHISHLMGAMANGMAALTGLPVRFVFSHDSIGVGKNGPTHQPVEIPASLRPMPNMLVLRPADAVEAAECWEIALEQQSGPSTLVFARQALPTLRRTHRPESLSRRGAYVLAEAEGGARAATPIATGSEVMVALRARALLQAEGIPAALVSMPCCERFDAQDASYRATVLPPGGVRVAVDAAVRFGWDRYLGERGGFVDMGGFGASGPVDALYELFGTTPAAVAAEAKRWLASA